MAMMPTRIYGGSKIVYNQIIYFAVFWSVFVVGWLLVLRFFHCIFMLSRVSWKLFFDEAGERNVLFYDMIIKSIMR